MFVPNFPASVWEVSEVIWVLLFAIEVTIVAVAAWVYIKSDPLFLRDQRLPAMVIGSLGLLGLCLAALAVGAASYQHYWWLDGLFLSLATSMSLVTFLGFSVMRPAPVDAVKVATRNQFPNQPVIPITDPDVPWR